MLGMELFFCWAIVIDQHSHKNEKIFIKVWLRQQRKETVQERVLTRGQSVFYRRSMGHLWVQSMSHNRSVERFIISVIGKLCYDGPNRAFSGNWRPMLVFEGQFQTYVVFSYLLVLHNNVTCMSSTVWWQKQCIVNVKQLMFNSCYSTVTYSMF